MERRIAAIVAADMVGFSRLVELDETGTLDRQKRHFAELIEPAFARHNGNIIKTTGDGLIAEFPSVVDAVQCCVHIQKEMPAREADISDDLRIRYRVGINLGDVIFDENDVLGDGVNVAARLEGLAEPGGIVVSGTAHDMLKANVEVGYEDLGEQLVKNIATPVRVYKVVPGGESPTQATSTRRKTPLKLGFAAALAVFVVFAIWQWSPRLGGDPFAGASIPEAPNGPKVAVLPFENRSEEPDQDYFVDGLTEDLTTKLSGYPYIFVMAYNSAAKFKDKDIESVAVGRELNVDFVTTGTVRRAGDRIRVTAQLVNVGDGSVAWAQTYDRKLDVENLFSIQDELTIRIAEAIGGSRGEVLASALRGTETKRPQRLESYECVLLSYRFWNSLARELHARARDCLEDVVREEPDYAFAWTRLASMYRAEYTMRVNPREDPLGRALAAVEQSLKLDPNDADAHYNHAQITFFNRQSIESIRKSLDRALELAPQRPYLLHQVAMVLCRIGDFERCMAVWSKASQFDPSAPAWTYTTPMGYHIANGEYAEAYQFVHKIKRSWGGWYWTDGFEASLLAHLERPEEARQALSRALEKSSKFPSIAMKQLDVWYWMQPQIRDSIMDGLYVAGLERSPSAEN